MNSLVEKYYTVTQLAFLFERTNETIIDRIKRGDYGHGVINTGSEAKPDYLVPVSGINAYIAARRLFSESPDLEPIAARSEGELRRKHAA